MDADALTERERMISGRTYRSTDPELSRERAATKRILHEYNNTHPDDEERRMELLRGLLGSVDELLWIEPPFRCDYGAQISMGRYVYANYDLAILDCAPVTIGDMVLFGPRVTLATASHPIDFHQRTVDMFEYAQPITIGEGAWLGAHVVVGPGVTIGARAVIGAGSIVTKDIPADVVAVGNPCRVVREITEQDRAAYLAAYGPAREVAEPE
ncbi:sugar O-acetyltransferase [Microbacterium sp.]|uniref:sugar O-acetyltransferase n=1 Tax=Microbacterium sp. TaxID=51671 RepID=UPI0039E2F37F